MIAIDKKNKLNLKNVISGSSLIPSKIFIFYGIFISFPAIVLFGQNISSLIFLFIFYKVIQSKAVFKINTLQQTIAILFGIGAILSVINIQNKSSIAISNALQVLPNYLYWVVVMIFFVSQRNLIVKNYYYISKGIMIGIMILIPYNFIQYSIPTSPFHLWITENNFSFLCICFTPIAVYHIKAEYNVKYAYIFAFICILANAYAGRRIGTTFVFFGCLLTMGVGKNAITSAIRILVIVVAVVGLLQLDIAKEQLMKISPRVYDMFYNSEAIATEDRSLLFRKAMVEKGLTIFENNMITGIGLNNFSLDNTGLSGNFEGAKYVANKDLHKSAHNSYILLLAEGGLAVFVPFILILLSIMLSFVFYLRKIPPFFKPIFIGILFMSIHLYYISAIVNIFTWVLISIGLAVSTYVSKKYNI